MSTNKVLLLTLVAVLVACNRVPVRNLTGTYAVQVQELRDNAKPAQLDILWVIDQSSSMCQEQTSLAANFASFWAVFKKYTAIEMNLAVVTSSVCDRDLATGNRGRFAYHPATSMPADCREMRTMFCVDDADCQDPSLGFPDPANWKCEPANSLSVTYTCDMPGDGDAEDATLPGDHLVSFASACRYSCDREAAPAACARNFGTPAGCADVCAGGTCSTSTCATHEGLSTSADQDAACAQVCNASQGCTDRCITYLGDASKCGAICASTQCVADCITANYFQDQDFLCSLSCAPTSECQDRCIAAFGEDTYRCVYPGNDKAQAGCLLPPKTAYCPSRDIGPRVLNQEVANQFYEQWKAGTWTNADPAWKGLDEATVRDRIFEQLFLCMAQLGASQEQCTAQEQGLLAAWMALDPNGENAAQAKAFLRNDAYLLVVSVSDEDDCSTTGNLVMDDYPKCACLRDADGCLPSGGCDPTQPGPLFPATSFVNRLKSLKKDPAMVVFAAIVGNVQPGSATSPGSDALVIRQRYYDCRCNAYAYRQGTYACLSRQGKAEMGSRYIQVADAFGPAFGQISNICDDRGLEPALERIANLVIPLMTKVCLPRPLSEEEFLNVFKVGADGASVLLAQTTASAMDGDYFLVDNAPDCPRFDASAGERTLNAIQFTQPLEYQAKLEVLYSAQALNP